MGLIYHILTSYFISILVVVAVLYICKWINLFNSTTSKPSAHLLQTFKRLLQQQSSERPVQQKNITQLQNDYLKRWSQIIKNGAQKKSNTAQIQL